MLLPREDSSTPRTKAVRRVAAPRGGSLMSWVVILLALRRKPRSTAAGFIAEKRRRRGGGVGVGAGEVDGHREKASPETRRQAGSLLTSSHSVRSCDGTKEGPRSVDITTQQRSLLRRPRSSSSGPAMPRHADCLVVSPCRCDDNCSAR
jgi:hypothetical protein